MNNADHSTALSQETKIFFHISVNLQIVTLAIYMFFNKQMTYTNPISSLKCDNPPREKTSGNPGGIPAKAT